MRNQLRQFTLIFLFISLIHITVAAAQEYGVYQYVIQNAAGSVDEVSGAIQNAAENDGWKVAAKIEMGQPDDCNFKAQVIILLDSSYASQLLNINSETAPFAMFDRINVFEDEAGINVRVVNPHSINRTVLMDDSLYESLSAKQLAKISDLIETSVKGDVSEKQYGQIREEGYISRTMGVMAGGLFVEKIEDIQVIPNASLSDVAQKVKSGLSKPGPDWGLHQIFDMELAGYNTVVFGISSAEMESRSFDIVAEGEDDSREDYACPGLAHAAAYPFNVVVTKKDDDVKIRMVTSMFRMKMFFEDAGKWAFMKNMTMPGSLASEVEDLIKAGLKVQ